MIDKLGRYFISEKHLQLRTFVNLKFLHKFPHLKHFKTYNQQPPRGRRTYFSTRNC